MVGAGLGVATVLLGHFGTWALLTALGVSLLGAYAVLTVNYLFFAIFLTDYVVVLLALLGLPADQTAVDRLIGTGVGAALALLAYILWPTWERCSASEKFARLILTECRFSGLLLHAWSDPGSDEARQAVASKLSARRARLDADASADRLTDEPERPPMTRELGQALISAGHRLAITTLALEAAVGAHHTALREAEAVQPAPRSARQPAPLALRPASPPPRPASLALPPSSPIPPPASPTPPPASPTRSSRHWIAWAGWSGRPGRSWPSHCAGWGRPARSRPCARCRLSSRAMTTTRPGCSRPPMPWSTPSTPSATSSASTSPADIR